MKRSITYREITVAIGILVAMVIALTLWIGLPETDMAATQESYSLSLHSVKQLFQNPQLLFSANP